MKEPSVPMKNWFSWPFVRTYLQSLSQVRPRPPTAAYCVRMPRAAHGVEILEIIRVLASAISTATWLKQAIPAFESDLARMCFGICFTNACG